MGRCLWFRCWSGHWYLSYKSSQMSWGHRRLSLRRHCGWHWLWKTTCDNESDSWLGDDSGSGTEAGNEEHIEVDMDTEINAANLESELSFRACSSTDCSSTVKIKTFPYTLTALNFFKVYSFQDAGANIFNYQLFAVIYGTQLSRE